MRRARLRGSRAAEGRRAPCHAARVQSRAPGQAGRTLLRRIGPPRDWRLDALRRRGRRFAQGCVGRRLSGVRR